jgi:hypothetical protein
MVGGAKPEEQQEAAVAAEQNTDKKTQRSQALSHDCHLI